MATASRTKRTSVIDLLLDEPYRFDLFQAVKLLELSAVLDSQESDSGNGMPPSVRFVSAGGGAFPASAIQDVERGTEIEATYTVDVNAIGLSAINGPVPAPYTDLIRQRSAKGDHALRDFLDIFNHRLIRLLLDIRRKNFFTIHSENPSSNPFDSYLKSILGLGTPWIGDRLGNTRRTLSNYCGIAGREVRSGHGLERILNDHLGLEVRIKPFKGGWYPIEEDDQTVIGRSGRNQCLGKGTVLGRRVWAQDWKFSLDVGPCPWPRFDSLLPSRKGFEELCALVRFYAGVTLRFQVTLILGEDQVRPCRLSYAVPSEGEDEPGDRSTDSVAAKLGWTSFLTGGKCGKSPPRRVRLGGFTSDQDRGFKVE